jgi:hypothetical protein
MENYPENEIIIQCLISVLLTLGAASRGTLSGQFLALFCKFSKIIIDYNIHIFTEKPDLARTLFKANLFDVLSSALMRYMSDPISLQTILKIFLVMCTVGTLLHKLFQLKRAHEMIKILLAPTATLCAGFRETHGPGPSSARRIATLGLRIEAHGLHDQPTRDESHV